jgi:hypothetical protein
LGKPTTSIISRADRRGMSGMWPVCAICNAPREGFIECAFPKRHIPSGSGP